MTMDKRAFITNGKIDNDGCPCVYCGINLFHDFTIGTTINGWTYQHQKKLRKNYLLRWE